MTSRKKRRTAPQPTRFVEPNAGLCLNCDAPITGGVLFCTDLCRQEAKFVRYFRAWLADGRARRLDVKEALKKRMALILGGGYPEHQRALSPEVRRAVREREEGRCRVCGAPGAEIDHVDGSSSSLDNLQFLCRECHDRKTTSNFTIVTPWSHPLEWAKKEQLEARAHAKQPLRACDRPDWAQTWRQILKRRQVEWEQPAEVGTGVGNAAAPKQRSKPP